MGPSLDSLPNELLQQVLMCLPAGQLLNFQLVCHRFHDLVGPLIWRRLCLDTYCYWQPQHLIEKRARANIDATDWKALFVERLRIDRQTKLTLDSILGEQVRRVEKFGEILAYGYDAKDCLLQQIRVGDEVKDVLARRFYGNAVLACIHRNMAVEEWAKIKDHTAVRLERAIGAFDAFVIHHREGDFDEITRKLDGIARSVLARHPDIAAQTTRRQAVLVAQCLREMRIVGFFNDEEGNATRNHFLGVALHSNDHSSLTLVSTVIYCCVAKRLGLDAMPGVFPFQVLAIVRAPQGVGLDGVPNADASENTMYLNPSASDEESSKEDLTAQLVHIGVPRDSHSLLLAPSTVEVLVLRAARNIRNSVYASDTAMVTNLNASGNDTSSPYPDLESSLYSALWALLFLENLPDEEGPTIALRRRTYLPRIVEFLENDFPCDVDLVEKHLIPAFESTGDHRQLQESIRVIRSSDTLPKKVKHRRDMKSKDVKYQVGQVFCHRRYGYIAVITGWDIECAANEHWIQQMRVNELPRGRYQSFYHAMVADKSVRYVAEENIALVFPDIPHTLMPLAGRHFKRWDIEKRRFVSNIRDEYPDD